MDPFCLNSWLSNISGGAALLSDPVWIDQVVVDSRRVSSSNALFIALKGQYADGHAYLQDAAERGARYAIVQKGFFAPSSLPKTLTLFYVEEPLRALQQIAKLYRQEKKVKVIAVTGSRGKTLMKDLLVHLLAPLGSNGNTIYGSPESFNSQVGVALSLLRIRKTHTLAVLEAGISESGEMPHLAEMLAPEMALLLNLMPELGAPLSSLETLAQEKMQLLTAVSEAGHVFLPALSCLKPYHKGLRGRVFEWGTACSIGVMPTGQPHHYAVILPGILNPYIMQLPAAYFAELISQALCVAYELGVSSEQLVEQLSLYITESMETQIWRTTQGVTLINSPYCADAQSIASTLRHLKQTPPGSKRFFFLHGLRAPSDLQGTLICLKHAIEKKEVDTVVVCGLAAEKQVGMIHVQDVSEGLQWIAQRAQHGDHVACKGSHQLSLETLTHAFQDRTPYNRCRIDLARIAHNITLLKAKLPQGAQLMVMVKALAYGTEATRMARFLGECGIAFLGVSFVDEGVALKQAGVTQSIFSLYIDPQEVSKAVRFDLHVGVDSLQMVRALERESALQGKKTFVHLHIDTGMRRLGCRVDRALEIAQEIANSAHLSFEGLFSHFVAAEIPEEEAFTEEQFALLTSVYQTLKENGIFPTYVHMGNSSSLVKLPHLVGNMVRVGLALYGLYDGKEEEGSAPFLEALSLHSHIIALHSCLKGESVGYGRRYIASKDELIAVVPLGYFDGISRKWSGKVSFLVRGARVPIVAVCMDYLMLDVTAVNAEVGDPVLIFGEDGHGAKQPLQILAQEGEEIAHALLAQIGPRIPRIFIWRDV